MIPLAALGRMFAGALERQALRAAEGQARRAAEAAAQRAAEEAARPRGRAQLQLTPLERLRKKQARAVAIGTNRAAKPTREAMMAAAGRIALRGFTAKSIGTFARQYAKASVAVIGPKMRFERSLGKWKRGPRKGQKKRAVPYLYARLIEKGTVRSRKRPFIGPAMADAVHFPERARLEIERELARILAG